MFDRMIKGALLFAAGAAVGAAGAMWLMSDQGKKVRGELRDLASQTKDKMQEYCEQAKDKMQVYCEQAKGKIQECYEQVKHDVEVAPVTEKEEKPAPAAEKPAAKA